MSVISGKSAKVYRRCRDRSRQGRPGLGDAETFQHRFGVDHDTFSHTPSTATSALLPRRPPPPPLPPARAAAWAGRGLTAAARSKTGARLHGDVPVWRGREGSTAEGGGLGAGRSRTPTRRPLLVRPGATLCLCSGRREAATLAGRRLGEPRPGLVRSRRGTAKSVAGLQDRPGALFAVSGSKS